MEAEELHEETKFRDDLRFLRIAAAFVETVQTVELTFSPEDEAGGWRASNEAAVGNDRPGRSPANGVIVAPYYCPPHDASYWASGCSCSIV